MLLNQTDINYLTGVFIEHFATFSSGVQPNRLITVYKEPLKIINSSQQGLFGYENNDQEQNITNIEQKQSFYGIITYKDNQKQKDLLDLNTSTFDGDVRIKVDAEARNFINNGNNIFIEFDSKKFNLVTSDRIQNYLGKEYYVYHLKEIT